MRPIVTFKSSLDGGNNLSFVVRRLLKHSTTHPGTNWFDIVMPKTSRQQNARTFEDEQKENRNCDLRAHINSNVHECEYEFKSMQTKSKLQQSNHV